MINNTNIRKHYSTLVPGTVQHKLFWARYFYKVRHPPYSWIYINILYWAGALDRKAGGEKAGAQEKSRTDQG